MIPCLTGEGFFLTFNKVLTNSKIILRHRCLLFHIFTMNKNFSLKICFLFIKIMKYEKLIIEYSSNY